MVLCGLTGSLAAQELEPRALTNTPIGVNAVLVGTGALFGNVLLDPAVPIEDGTADLWTVGLGYVRSVGLFGMGGKFSVLVPFASGTWQAQFNGADTSTSRTGFGDPVLKFSLNFLGAPALTMGQFRNYRHRTVAGISMAVSLPLGQYYPERLINLGSNRWSLATRLGVSHAIGNWLVEAYGGVTVFTRNDDFFGGKTVTQDPLIDTQAHLVRQLGRPTRWVAASVGYAWGAQSTVNGVPKSSLENLRLSLALSLPAWQGHSFRFAYINGVTTRIGGDFDTFQVVWLYAFGGRR